MSIERILMFLSNALPVLLVRTKSNKQTPKQTKRNQNNNNNKNKAKQEVPEHTPD